MVPNGTHVLGFSINATVHPEETSAASMEVSTLQVFK
jgi:hypothetical protein